MDCTIGVLSCLLSTINCWVCRGFQNCCICCYYHVHAYLRRKEAGDGADGVVHELKMLAMGT